jgi:hypothetical protein
MLQPRSCDCLSDHLGQNILAKHWVWNQRRLAAIDLEQLAVHHLSTNQCVHSLRASDNAGRIEPRFLEVHVEHEAAKPDHDDLLPLNANQWKMRRHWSKSATVSAGVSSAMITSQQDIYGVEDSLLLTTLLPTTLSKSRSTLHAGWPSAQRHLASNVH